MKGRRKNGRTFYCMKYLLYSNNLRWLPARNSIVKPVNCFSKFWGNSQKFLTSTNVEFRLVRFPKSKCNAVENCKIFLLTILHWISSSYLLFSFWVLYYLGFQERWVVCTWCPRACLWQSLHLSCYLSLHHHFQKSWNALLSTSLIVAM